MIESGQSMFLYEQTLKVFTTKDGFILTGVKNGLMQLGIPLRMKY